MECPVKAEDYRPTLIPVFNCDTDCLVSACSALVSVVLKRALEICVYEPLVVDQVLVFAGVP